MELTKRDGDDGGMMVTFFSFSSIHLQYCMGPAIGSSE